MKVTEEKIIRGILNGEHRWLREFQKRYRQRLLNFVLHKVGSYQDAEEIVQDTLMSAIYSLPSFLGKSSFLSWLCAIAKHEIADFYRKKKIKEILFSHIPGLEKIATMALSPELALEEKELKGKIIGCYFSLTEGYREILRLKYIDGLSVRQIANRLERSAKAIEMRLRRARHAFVRAWNDQKIHPKRNFTFNQGDLCFVKECLGIAGSSLPDTEAR